MPESTKFLAARRRVEMLEALRDGPTTAPALTRRLGYPYEQSTTSNLAWLEGLGLVVSWAGVGRNAPRMWALPEDRPEGVFDTADDAILAAARIYRSVPDIVRKTGLGRTSVKARVRRLVKEGKLRHSRGTYKAV